MRGGLGHRKFYVNQVNLIEHAYRSRLLKRDYSDKEVEAGYPEFVQEFGDYGTLMALEKETPYNHQQLLKMSVKETHFRLIYLNHEAAVDRRYNELMR